MVVGCLVHMAQSIWNGGGMHSPYDTVHMEWWWNGWSIWYSPYGMVVECLVHMAHSTWNGGEMQGHSPYGIVVECIIWHNPYGMVVESMVIPWTPSLIPYSP